jgi:hypothetical protein
VSGVPSVTGFGEPVFVIAISALLALATITVALALLLVKFGTTFVAVAESVSVMLVPDGVVEFTPSTRLKLPLPLTARLLLSVQLIVPVAPTAGTVPHVQPAGGVIDWNVVLGGVVSVNVTPVAAAGPLFVTLCVYVTLLPGETEVGVAEFVTIRSACVEVATTSLAVALLLARFGSFTDEFTVAVSLIAVPAVVPAATFNTYVTVTLPVANDVLVQVSVVVEQVHPGADNETTDVLAGSVSVMVALVAVLGPAFVTVCV